MVTLLLALSFAAEPTVEVVGDDMVRGAIVVELAPEVVRQRLADPVWVVQSSGDGTEVVITSREGGCLLADYASPSFLMTVRYSVRQCPTKDGFESKLITSNAFSSYRTQWVVKPEGSGSRVEYVSQLNTTLSVPSSWVTKSMKKGITQMLVGVQGKLTK